MPHNRFLPTIRSKLYSLVLFMFVPILLLQAAILYDRVQGRQAIEFQENMEVARAVAGTWNMFVESVLHQELAICINLTMHQNFSPDQMNRILAANRAALPEIRNFAWVNPQGRVVASNMEEVIGEEIADRPFARIIFEGKDWSVSDLMVSLGTGEPVFFISRGIRNEDGKLLGMVIGAVRAEKLRDILGLELSRGGAVSILDNRAVMVDCYPPRELKWEDRDYLQKRPALKEALQGKEITGIFPNASNGEDRIVTCTQSRATGWIVCVSRSKAEVMDRIWSQAMRQFSFSLLLSGLIFIAAFLLSHEIVSAIKRLREYAAALGRGEPNRRVDFKGSVELQELASSFHSMADQIGNREERLRRSEEKYRELVENANSIITRLDLDGKVIFFNEFAQRLFGYSEEEILGRHVIGTIMPETDSARTDLSATLDEVIRNPDRYATHEHENIRRNGDPVWVLWANRALLDEEGNVCGILGIGTDITARKTAVESLWRSEREKAAILGSLKDVAVEYLDPEMRVIWTNSATKHVFNLTSEELKGRICYEAIHNLSGPCEGCTAVKSVQSGTPQEGEIVRADGRAWLVSSNPVKDSTGRVTNVVHAAMDITQRRHMEEALRAEIKERKQIEAVRRLDEARLEALWQLSHLTEASITHIPQFSLEQLVRLTESKVGWVGFLDETGTILTVHCWPETGTRRGQRLSVEEADIFAEAIQEKKVIVRNDYSCSDCAMGTIPGIFAPVTRIMIVPIFGNDRVVAVAGVGNKPEEYNPSDARQITLLMDGTWKIMQREKAEKSLRESESLAAMGRAMAAVAHDMKTPLIAIGGFASLALKHIENGSPIRDKLEIVVKETRRMENMVKSLLDFSRPLKLDRSEGDLASLAAECITIVTPLAQAGKIQLRSRFGSCAAVAVRLDFMRMKQVLINLLSNAIHASQEGGEVVMECALKQDKLSISVVDSGCGIAADKKDEIFSPFYTTKKEGTGLGLPIVKKIVEAHLGYIEVLENPDRGMTFRVELPISE